MKKDSNENNKDNKNNKRPEGVVTLFVLLCMLVFMSWKSTNYEFFQFACSLLVIAVVYFKVKYPNDKVVDSLSTIVIAGIIAFFIIGIVCFINCIIAFKNCNSPV